MVTYRPDRHPMRQPGARWPILPPLALLALTLTACAILIVPPQAPGPEAATSSRADQTGNPSTPSEGSTEPAGFNRSPQKSEAGSVTIEVTWGTTGTVELAFAVSLDTHSVDLDSYDLRQLALLRTDQGTEAHAVGWDAPTGGHHRSGTLTFPAAADGRSLVGPETRRVELLVHDVAGVPERSFLWMR